MFIQRLLWVIIVTVESASATFLPEPALSVGVAESTTRMSENGLIPVGCQHPGEANGIGDQICKKQLMISGKNGNVYYVEYINQIVGPFVLEGLHPKVAKVQSRWDWPNSDIKIKHKIV